MPQLEIVQRLLHPHHRRASTSARVQEVLQRVHDNGHTYKGLYEGWYCPRCADFKVENEILEGNRCPIHEIELTREQRGELVLPRCRRFQEPLEQLYRRAPRLRDARATTSTRRARSSPQGLQDVSLSRAQLSWGVTVPWDPSHVFYVWFDALLNYYTALGYARARRGSDRALLAGDASTSSARTSSSSTRSSGRRC